MSNAVSNAASIAQAVRSTTAPDTFRHYWLPGTTATALIAIGALGIGWIPPASTLAEVGFVDLLRSTTAGSLAARALVVIGLAMLLQAWLLVGAHLRSHPGDDESGVRPVIGLLIAWSAPLLVAPPMFSRDAYSYFVQGRLLVTGEDPTLTGIAEVPRWFDYGADPMWTQSETPYGPLFLIIERAVSSALHPHGFLGALAFRLVAIAGLALLAYFLVPLAKGQGARPVQALWLAVLNPLVLLHFVSGVHNDALMVGLVVAGLALACQLQCLWGAVAIGLAASVKPIALVALPFVGLLWAGADATWLIRIKSWLLAGLVAVAVMVSMLFLAGAGEGMITAAFGTPGGVLTWLSPSTAIGQGLGNAASALDWVEDPMSVLSIVRAAGTAMALAVIVWLVLTPGRRSPVRGAGLAFGVLVVLGPVVQPWYLLWALPLIAAGPLSPAWHRVIVLGTAFFTVHAMVESTTNADNQLAAADLIAFGVSIAIVLAVVLGSRSERGLIWAPDGRIST